MLTTEPPKPTRLNTGIRILDERLGGGFERPCALLLFSRTPAEKRLFAEQFVMTGLRAGEPCLYVDFFRAWREIGEAARAVGAAVAFLFINWTYGDADVARVVEMSDYVVEFQTRVRTGVVRNYLRIAAQRPGGLSTAWIPYTFKDVSGLTVYFPRILVIGPPNAGKTTVVRALCGNSVSVDTMGTTVAFDYGNLDLSGLEAEVIGTPGQERFEFMFGIFAREVSGILLVLDATRPEELERAKSLLQLVGAESSVVVLANKSDLPGRLDEAAIRAGLGLAADVPVIPSVATTGQGTKEAVLALAQRVMGV